MITLKRLAKNVASALSVAAVVLCGNVDANHQQVDKGTVTFDVPKKGAAAPSDRMR